MRAGRARRTLRVAAAAGLWLLAPAAAARAQSSSLPPARGPLEAREEFLPALPRLTLPARAADTLPVGRSLLRLDVDWGSDFAHRRGYLFDGEHSTLALSWRRGLARQLSLGLRLPLRYRGGGVLDGLIDAVHSLGLPDGGRGRVPRNQLTVLAFAPGGAPLQWQGRQGTGLGKLEIEAHWSPRAAASGAAGFALAGRVALPTGTGVFAGGGVETAVQLLAGVALGRRARLHAGLGGVLSDRSFEGLRYERLRAYLFAGLEWQLGQRWSLLLQADGASRLLEQVEDYPGFQSYVRLGAKRDVGRGWRLEAGVSENVTEQQATTDFGLWLGVSRRF